jgi:N-acetylglucosamine malate deacetylase 2
MESTEHTGARDRRAEVLGRISPRMGDSSDPLRVLAIFAHPDDEVLALGARLGRFNQSQFLCVTDGAPENGVDARAHGFTSVAAYRAARRLELEHALKLAGVPTCCARPLLIEESGGSYTMVADQAAAFHLVGIVRQIARAISEFCPEAILTHPYEGGHPDHDSCAFAVHAAVRMLGRADAIPVVEAPFYHAGPTGTEVGTFLPEIDESFNGSSTLRTNASIICTLSPEEQRRKRALLDCFVSQRETLAPFGIEQEQFRLAPDYDFTHTPHAGRLLYENYDWGLTGARFCQLARAALDTLEIRNLPA